MYLYKNEKNEVSVLEKVLKVGLSPFKKIIFFNDSPLKMMKNAIYFILKPLFVLKTFKFFVLTFWACRKNDLIRKMRLISKFMTSQPC